MTIVPKIISNKTIMNGGKASSLLKQAGKAVKISKHMKEPTLNASIKSFALDTSSTSSLSGSSHYGPFHVVKKMDMNGLSKNNDKKDLFKGISKNIIKLLHASKNVKVLPPIESTPIIIIKFTSKARPDLVGLVKERLVEGNVVIATEDTDDNGDVLLGITTTQEELELEAEHLNLVRPSTLRGLTEPMNVFEWTVVMDQFEVSNRDSFRPSSQDTRDDLVVYDQSGIFTSADRVMILNNLIESLSVMKPKVESSLLAMKLNEKLCIPTNELSARFHQLYLLDTLRKQHFVDEVVPMHVNLKSIILSEALNPKTPIPVQAMRNYYGEEVAYYFAWMNFYTKALIFPGLFGLIVSTLRTFRGESIDTDTLTPFHGLFTFIWAIMFIQFWSREEVRLSYKWGTMLTDKFSETLTVRHEFQGTMRISEVTKMPEIYYPAYKRRLHYCFSALVTLTLLAGAFFVMILSLNMQGYIKPKFYRNNLYSTTEEDCYHPFHFKHFAKLSKKGNIFDSTSTVQSTLAVILHVALVLSMNTIYRRIAKYLTDKENHECPITYNNSLIFKRFFFEAFDSYLVLMYLAFYEQDVLKVRSELMNVFHVDTFRRLLLEGVIPFVMTKYRIYIHSRSTGQMKKDDDKNHAYQSPMTEEIEREEYEEFDDYIEMIIQLGYICLFASAYPLAPFVAIAANFVEVRLDAFKITHIHRRPVATRVRGIGVWAYLIKCIVWLSAFTNCMIFCFSSMQMVQFLPDYFTIDPDGEHDLKDGNGWQVVFIVFGIERFLLVVGILLNLAIPEIPEDVKVKVQQKKYIQMRLHHVEKSQKNM